MAAERATRMQRKSHAQRQYEKRAKVEAAEEKEEPSMTDSLLASVGLAGAV